MNRRLAVIAVSTARLANRVERDCGINVTGSRLRNSISLSLSRMCFHCFVEALYPCLHFSNLQEICMNNFENF